MTPTRSVSAALSILALVGVGASCAPKEEVTPLIVVSPGAKDRIARMDQLRHYGAPRRLLPHVTVEEVDEADLPAASDEAAPPGPDADDAGP